MDYQRLVKMRSTRAILAGAAVTAGMAGGTASTPDQVQSYAITGNSDR